MKFDYTKGQEAKYVLIVTQVPITDLYYFHYYREAKRLYKDIIARAEEEKRSINVSISDLKKDMRLDFSYVRPNKHS